MRKTTFSLFLCFALSVLFTFPSFITVAQVPVFGPETFGSDTVLPAGWIVNDGANDKNTWEMINTVYPSTGYTTPEPSGGSHIKIDATAAWTDYLYTPFIDCSGYTNGVLKFGAWRAVGNNRTLIISIELNGDLNFTKYRYYIPHTAMPEREKWFLISIDLKNLIDNKQKVRIRFGLSATVNYAGPIRIDDITLYATPSIPTNHYRTRTSGNWNDLQVWESSQDSISWILSGSIPTHQASSITIRNTHNVINTTPQTADQLTIKNGGALTLSHDFNLNNGAGCDLVVEEGGALDLSTHHITGTGTLSLSGHLKTAHPEGLWGTDSSSLAKGISLNPIGINSTIEYNAKNRQNISPFIPYAHLLTSNNGEKQLAGPVTISKTLQVSGGHLLLNDYDLAVGHTTTGTPTSYIKINGTGKLTISDIGSVAKKFPIGNTSYNPVTVSEGSGLNWTVGIEDRCASPGPGFAVLSSKSVHRTWSITPSLNPPPLAAEVTLEYNDADQGQVGTEFNKEALVQVWRQAEYGWLGAGGTQSPLNTPNGTRTASFSSDGFFSLFMISNMSAPLPIRFRNVSARQIKGTVAFSFTNVSESGVENYILERSADGMTYKHLQVIYPMKNDATQVTYEIKDLAPLEGLNLYRVKGKEKGGQITYTPVIRVHTKDGEARLTVVPNPPHNGEISVQLTHVPQDLYKISLYNAKGQLLQQQSLHHAGGSTSFPLKIDHLQPGTYLIELAGKEKLLQRFVVL